MATVLGDDKGQENQQNTSGSLDQDVGSAIRMGEDAARAAKKAAKDTKTVATASAHLAAGDVAGAAAEVAKNPGAVLSLLKVAVGIVAAVALLIVIVLHVLPTALYDHIEGYFDQIGTKWEEIYVSNKYGGNAIANFFAWVGEISGSNPDYGIANAYDTDYERELAIMDNEYAEKLALINRIYIVNEKLRTRAEQLKNSVSSSDAKTAVNTFLENKILSSRWRNDIGDYQVFYTPVVTVSLESPFEALVSGETRQRKGLNKLKQMAEEYPQSGSKEEKSQWKDEFNKTIYDMDTETGYFSPEDNSNALRILSLITVQKNASVQGLKPIDLMKSLGWYSTTFGGSKTTTVKLGNAVNFNILDWKGTFIPQYMEEEKKSLQEQIDHLEIKKNGYVGQQSLIDAANAKQEEYRAAIENYDNKGVALVDLLIALDYPNLNIFDSDVKYDPSKTVTRHRVTTNGDRYDIYYYFNNPDGEGTLSLHEWYTIPPEEPAIPGVPVSVTPSPITHYYQFTIKAYVLCRDISSVNDAVGFWNGSFEDDLNATYGPENP